MKHLAHILGGLLLIAGCESNSNMDDGKRLVIEAFLYEGQRIDDVQVKELVPLSSGEGSYLIADAQVLIRTSAGMEFMLNPMEDEPGRYFTDEVIVERGVVYELEAVHEDQVIRGETFLPAEPTGLSLSTDILHIRQITDFSQLGSRSFEDVILSWDNPNADPFFVQVDNIEDTGNIIDLNFPGGQSFGGGFQLVTEPTVNDSYVLITRTMEDYGLYQIVLFSLNQEYVDLYETSGEDSRSFSEPLTNIENGLGIFTAFSSDTTYLTIDHP